mgnify:CR=1 FL=1
MSKRFVPFPEAGAGAKLCLTLDGQQALYDAFGPGYQSIIHLGLLGASPVIITRCLAVMMTDEDEDGMADAPWDLELDEIAARLLDAWNLQVHGLTTAELQKREAAIEERTIQYLREMSENEPEKFAEKVQEALSADDLARKARIARRKAEAAVKAESAECPL